MVRRAFRKMVIEGVEAFAEAFWKFENEEEDNGTVKWRENFKSFERYKKRKRQEMMVVDKSTCQLTGGGWWSVKSVNGVGVSARSHVDRRSFNFLVFSSDESQLMYGSGHRVWWRGQEKGRWSRSVHSHRFWRRRSATYVIRYRQVVPSSKRKDQMVWHRRGKQIAGFPSKLILKLLWVQARKFERVSIPHRYEGQAQL